MGKISDALEKAQERFTSSSQTTSGKEAKQAANGQQPVDLNQFKPQSEETKTFQDTSLEKAPDYSRAKKAAPSRPRHPSAGRPISGFEQSRIDAKLITYNAPDSFEAEQFRMLRTSILFPKNGKLSRNIMIASTAPAEGKSFVAANLAISIAQNVDKHVLLIDCDMRKPSIHRLFGFNALPGLSDYLTQGTPLKALIQNTFIERLCILPGGTPPPNPSELLSSRRMEDLLKEVALRYNDRFIIIDTPPIQLTAEAHALAKFADAVFLIVRFGNSNKEMVTEVINKVGKKKILGIIGNFVGRKSVYRGYAKKYAGYYDRYPEHSKKNK